MSAFSEFDHHQFSDSIPFSSWYFLSVEYHFVSDPSPGNDQRPAGNLFANRDTSVALAIHSVLLSLFPHMMSLNIDMKIIRPWNSSGFSLIFDKSPWTLLQSCNVVNPGKICHSNSIGSPSIVSKALYCVELLNHVNVSSQTVFDFGFWFIFPRHNTESENT